MISLLVAFPLMGFIGAAFLARHILKIERNHYAWSVEDEMAELTLTTPLPEKELVGSFS
jgi:hypothetical protein